MSSDATKFSFSPGAEDYIRRFMDSAMIMVRREFPTTTSWIAVIDWALSCVGTLRATGEVIRTGAHFGVGALETDKLTNEPIVRLHNGLDVALGSLPEDLASLDHITFDVRDNYLVIPNLPGYDPLPRPYIPS